MGVPCLDQCSDCCGGCCNACCPCCGGCCGYCCAFLCGGFAACVPLTERREFVYPRPPDGGGQFQEGAGPTAVSSAARKADDPKREGDPVAPAVVLAAPSPVGGGEAAPTAQAMAK